MQLNAARLALVTEPLPRSLTILNLSGDSTLTWSEKNDALMRELIEKKMKEGFAFFILKPRFGGFLGLERRVRITDVSEAMDARRLSLDDEDFARIIAEGGIQLVTRSERIGGSMGDAVQSRDPDEIAMSHSVAVRQMSGG